MIADVHTSFVKGETQLDRLEMLILTGSQRNASKREITVLFINRVMFLSQ